MDYRHELADDITAASVTDLITDGGGVAYLHFDNGVILAFSAALVKGAPVRYATCVVTRVLH